VGWEHKVILHASRTSHSSCALPFRTITDSSGHSILNIYCVKFYQIVLCVRVCSSVRSGRVRRVIPDVLHGEVRCLSAYTHICVNLNDMNIKTADDLAIIERINKYNQIIRYDYINLF